MRIYHILHDIYISAMQTSSALQVKIIHTIQNQTQWEKTLDPRSATKVGKIHAWEDN